MTQPPMRHWYYNFPVARRVLKKLFLRLASLLGIPEIQHRLDLLDTEVRRVESLIGPVADLVERRASDISGALNTQVASTHEALSSAIESLAADQQSLAERQSAHFENRLTSLNEALVAFVDAKDEQQRLALVASMEELADRQVQIRQTVDTLRLQVGLASTNQSASLVAPTRELSVIDDAFYVTLENHFRGSRDLIAERQQSYLVHLPQVISIDHPVVDLGCGRGEWMAALQDHGIPARGVDSNVVCVAECASKNFQVELADILDYLQRQPDQSVGTFTMFQVLEHLSFDVLLGTLRQIRRVLVPGGRLIAEVPNAKNLRVAAGTFWIDPTHQRPLYPELLLFLAEELGFSSAEGIYVNDLSPKFDLSSLPDGPREALQRLVDAVDTAGDFALVATA